MPTSCNCRAPWVYADMLGGIKAGIDGVQFVACPETLHCLRRAPIVDGAIGAHFRNVPGMCPWVEVRVRQTAPPCGCTPAVTTRQLGAHVIQNRTFKGRAHAVFCPGCHTLALIENNRFVDHHHGRCPWIGVRLLEQGTYPPLFTPQASMASSKDTH